MVTILRREAIIILVCKQKLSESQGRLVRKLKAALKSKDGFSASIIFTRLENSGLKFEILLDKDVVGKYDCLIGTKQRKENENHKT